MNNIWRKTGFAAAVLLTQASTSYGYFETLSTSESILADPVVNAVVNDPLGQLKDETTEGTSDKNAAIGGEYVNTDKTDILNIPFSFGMPIGLIGGRERLNFNANLAYVDTSSPILTNDESGIGDTAVGVDYSYFDNGLTVIPTLTVKLPTGDEDKGLGTGSTDVAATIAVKKSMGQANVNGKFGYIYKGEGEPIGLEFDYGDIFTADVGGRYQVMDSLWISLNGVYIDQDGNEQTSTGVKSGGLSTMDVIPMLTFRVNNMFNINAKYIFAVDEDADNNATAPDREDSFTISVTSGF